MATDTREVWQCGPIENIPALLQPVAHALLQARNEIVAMSEHFPDSLLWERLAETASPAFHLQHLTGVLDRVFTYARGEILNEKQFNFLAAEGKKTVSIRVADLVLQFVKQVDIALAQLSTTDTSTLTDVRFIGRQKLPTTVIGLLFHAAEHTMRHTGQLYVTIKVLKNNIAE
jgi:uncharacterized damage-inducible protein DinB